jgi:hypothetical protein
VAAFTGLPGDIINKMPPPSLDYRVDYANWQKVIDMMREFGVLKKVESPDRFMAEAIKPYILKS